MSTTSGQTVYGANLAAWPDRHPRPPVSTLGDAVRMDVAVPFPALLVRDGQAWIAVHSRRNPLHEAERALEPLDVAHTSTLFAIGLGLGYTGDLLEQQHWPGRIIALEPEPSWVVACLRRRDWTDWLASGRLSLLWGPDYAGLDQLMPMLEPDRAEPVVLVNAVAARCYPERTEEAMRRIVRTWFGARANQEAKRRMAGRYLLNTLRNAPVIAASGDVDALANRFTGMPALLVAAGPSLDRNLPDIAAHRDRALIVAVDTALRPLLGAGIEPHLVVAVDPGEANARHLVDLPPCDTAHLVAEGSIDPEALRSFDGRHFVFRVGDHHPWPWLRAQGVERGHLRAWGSVLTTAFDLALRMGCNPIVFTGADLGFTGDQPYARGTTYEEDWRREQAWGRPLDESWRVRVAEWPPTRESGIGDTPVRTAPHLVAFRDWLVAEATRAVDRTVLNATGRGILHGGGVGQSTVDAALSACPTLGSAPQSLIAAARRTGRVTADWAPGPVSRQTEGEWRAFAEVSAEVMAQALGRRALALPQARPGRITEPSRETGPRAGMPPAGSVRDPAAYPELSEADTDCLVALGRTHTILDVPLRDPEQDLVAELRRAVSTLTPSSAVAILDLSGRAVGAQVRRALNVILCERTDVWLEYRRFVDRASRLSILRVDADRREDLAAVEAVKWLPAHEGVADSLAPLVAAELSPRSVIDLGCGAGFWLRAFERCGATRLRGLTVCRTEGAVHPGVTVIDPGEFLTGFPSLAPARPDRFDVCLALEIAHELPPRAHAPFVAACARLADAVVLSFRLPGVPGMSPHARPLAYWSDLFWEEGYVLEDRLRGAIEERWNFPRSVFDGPLVFRRMLTADQRDDPRLRTHHRALAVRIQELYEQSIWWAVRSFTLEAAEAVTPQSSPHMAGRTRWWPIPAWRLLGEPGATRHILFRTDAARYHLTDRRTAIEVREDGAVLARTADVPTLQQQPDGGWVLTRDELWVRSSDGSDPRTNGRCYTVRLPPFVAWAEDQPLADCLKHEL